MSCDQCGAAPSQHSCCACTPALKLCLYCQAANTAVSKSKRSICGHQVGSIAHTTDRVTHYRTCPTGQDAAEHQADLLPNTAAAHAAAASMQQAINLANFAASQNSLAAITRVGTNLPCVANSLFSSLDHRLTVGLLVTVRHKPHTM